MLSDASWRNVFELSAAHSLYWSVRLKDETDRISYLENPLSCYKNIYEPMDASRIGATAIADGVDGPFSYAELLWLRFPRLVRAGSCAGLHSDVVIDLAKVEAELARRAIQCSWLEDCIHIGERDTEL